MSDSMESPNVERLIQIGRELGKPFVSAPGQKIIVPAGSTLQDVPFEPDRPLPRHIPTVVKLAVLSSLVAYVKRYQTSATLIFLETKASAGALVTAVFDYHMPQKDCPHGPDGAAEEVRRLAHRAEYDCPFSDEFKLWNSYNGKPFNQDGFAKFLDDAGPDIMTPDHATLLELVMNFESITQVKFSSKIQRHQGTKQLTYSEVDEAGAMKGSQKSLKIPESMDLCMPIFRGGRAYELKAKIFLVAKDGSLSLWYELQRPNKVIDMAVADVANDIEAETERRPYFGTAPAAL